MKQMFAFVIMICLFSTQAQAFNEPYTYDSDTYNLYVDNVLDNSKCEKILYDKHNNIWYYSIRDLLECMTANVYWDGDTDSISFDLEGVEYVLLNQSQYEDYKMINICEKSLVEKNNPLLYLPLGDMSSSVPIFPFCDRYYVLLSTAKRIASYFGYVLTTVSSNNSVYIDKLLDVSINDSLRISTLDEATALKFGKEILKGNDNDCKYKYIVYRSVDDHSWIIIKANTTSGEDDYWQFPCVMIDYYNGVVTFINKDGRI